jgi:hypothetical protein
MRKSARSRFRVMTRKKARSSGCVRKWMFAAVQVFSIMPLVTPAGR